MYITNRNKINSFRTYIFLIFNIYTRIISFNIRYTRNCHKSSSNIEITAANAQMCFISVRRYWKVLIVPVISCLVAQVSDESSIIVWVLMFPMISWLVAQVSPESSTIVCVLMVPVISWLHKSLLSPLSQTLPASAKLNSRFHQSQLHVVTDLNSLEQQLIIYREPYVSHAQPKC